MRQKLWRLALPKANEELQKLSEPFDQERAEQDTSYATIAPEQPPLVGEPRHVPDVTGNTRRQDIALHDEIVSVIPRLRGFARSLCRNPDQTDDLVQETVLKALTHIDKFQPGTSLTAWLITILQNLFRSEYRRKQREVEDVDGFYANNQRFEPNQGYGIEAEEFPNALAKLPADQREALDLAVIAQLPYETIAEMCRIPVGTVKSRVNRARIRLSELMEINEVDAYLWKVRGREARRKLKQGKARRRLKQPL
jgi:RNA polymerase sigma-70 factor, ECF subfamily